MTIQLNLYSTSHCHLCEHAKEVLLSLGTESKLNWISIEISDDAHLLSLYELRIPVLKRLDTHEELNWPFNRDDVKQFIG